MQLDEPLLHASGFELEYALGVTPRIEIKYSRIVYRYLLYVYLVPESLLDKSEAAIDDGEGLEA